MALPQGTAVARLQMLQMAAADQAIAYSELMPCREGSAGMAKAEALLLLGRSAECAD